MAEPALSAAAMAPDTAAPEPSVGMLDPRASLSGEQPRGCPVGLVCGETRNANGRVLQPTMWSRQNHLHLLPPPLPLLPQRLSLSLLQRLRPPRPCLQWQRQRRSPRRHHQWLQRQLPLQPRHKQSRRPQQRRYQRRSLHQHKHQPLRFRQSRHRRLRQYRHPLQHPLLLPFLPIYAHQPRPRQQLRRLRSTTCPSVSQIISSTPSSGLGAPSLETPPVGMRRG